MSAIKKLAGVYLLGTAVAVAGFFIISIFLVETVNVLAVWHVLDVFELIGLILGLAFNCAYKKRFKGRDASEPVTRGYLEAHAAFYITLGVAIIFLHNWFVFLVTGDVSQGDNHTGWVIWAVVDTMLPIILGVTGCRLWREAGAA